MVDVIGGTGRDRGQLLLAGAFVLAVGLIGLTLVLTSGGYTTTLSSQDSAIQRGADAVAVRESVESDLARYLERANREYSPYSLRLSQFQAVMPDLAEGLRDQYGRHGRLVELEQPSPSGIDDGYRIAQPDGETFGDLDNLESDPDDDFTVATDAKARNVSFVFESVPAAPDQFRIEFETPSGSENWVVAVSQSGGGWDVTVTSTGGYSATCTRSGTASDMTMDLSAATVDGHHCPALEAIAPETNTYDVRLTGELGVDGRFWVTVDDLTAGKQSDYLASTQTDLDEVIYSADVPFRYHAPSVSYRTDLRIAPGEIR